MGSDPKKEMALIDQVLSKSEQALLHQPKESQTASMIQLLPEFYSPNSSLWNSSDSQKVAT
jgi:hypothetical protein